MSASLRLIPLLLIPALFSNLAPCAAAQHSDFGAELSARIILAHTRVDPIPGGETLEETRAVQPVLLLDARAFGHLRFHGTLNLEGWTIPQGELTPGSWGEGFIDRRHPHTYFHEIMLTGDDLLGRLDGALSLSVSAGKGVVPFGTDDPMSRPTLRYPVNHHLSQILERAVAIGGVRLGPLTFEAASFNGDEPENPEQWPHRPRLWDSWAVRGMVSPVYGIELQVSRAHVHSPEHRPGAGLDVEKWSVSGRFNRRIARVPAYLLVEWAESAEADRFFVFNSVLGEVQLSPGRHRGYYRFENTQRPEETRTANLFRAVRPHLENSLIGITRWKVHTAGYGLSAGRVFRNLHIEPFAEVSHATVESVIEGLFRPKQFYGGTTFWATSLGVRLDWGVRDHRMGRYGVAFDSAPRGH